MTPDHRPDPAGWRSILFVPGDRPDRFAKALASGADAVCVDLEDAVPPSGKAEARAATLRFLSEMRHADSRGPAVVVRVNHLSSRDGRIDAAALSSADQPGDLPVSRSPRVGGRAQALTAVMLPKVAAAGEVRLARSLLGDRVVLLPLIETALALQRAADIAAAGAEPDGEAVGRGAVRGVVFGGFDLSSELGCEPAWEPLLFARSRVVHAAALAGIPAFDMPARDLSATGAIREEALRARRLGFSGKIAIHPAQIPVLHEAFTPSPGEVERARGIVRADADAGGAAVALDGRMVDKPVVDRARRTLARAAAARSGSLPTRPL